ncbi:cyclohexanone monooxygenase [Capronia coronata CBS 617.96]|uniref:Cyclohexanone monooxygenase n=1 Tax=Capronia coronata CBS 617.96 TaxID=1182541 RepID=W9YXT4_9EURO|nr:cyclohexanone monooxygenase [Capronia coronata CBS 617.96]EXJ94480.1 cyclohexanone monooxygenase [Capronia coronata CBS 617.96]
MMEHQYLDALVVGAGFGGIYQLKKLLDQNLSVKLIDMAGDFGGTWYWNQYPGAMSDTESFLYRYSWDEEDLRSYPWNRYYLQGPEILAYLQNVVKRYGLRQHAQFNTELTKAQWDDAEGRWTVETSTGHIFKPKYLVTALGLLSRQNFPDIPGIETFKGDLHHTARWPKGLDLRGKRVGVIGNGSTGVQVITAIAKEVEQLVCFQRTPQYSVPSGDREVPPGYREDLNRRYTEVWQQAKNSMFAFGFEESTRPTFSVGREEREKIFEEAWQKGGGFRFMFETFCDISYDEAANEEAASFIRRKIGEIVKDPEKARKLMPSGYHARRPLCDTGYYQQFNRDNVDVVDLKETPITRITPAGIELSNGHVCELDVIVFATGFDAVDGNYTRVAIRGRDGNSLKEHWAEVGPTSYLGISVPDFPNMFMILGPNGPFTNLPPTIETQVEFISDLIEVAEQGLTRTGSNVSGLTDGAEPNGHVNGDGQGEGTGEAGSKRGQHLALEPTREAEEEWTDLCDKLSANSLFRKTDSWIFGSNVAGKKPAVMFYFAGLANYRKALKDVLENDLKGFKQYVHV